MCCAYTSIIDHIIWTSQPHRGSFSRAFIVYLSGQGEEDCEPAFLPYSLLLSTADEEMVSPEEKMWREERSWGGRNQPILSVPANRHWGGGEVSSMTGLILTEERTHWEERRREFLLNLIHSEETISQRSRLIAVETILLHLYPSPQSSPEEDSHSEELTDWVWRRMRLGSYDWERKLRYFVCLQM